MIRVSPNTSNRALAWRIRDALARHPLLGGATAQISVVVHKESVILEGWVLDEGVYQLAIKIAHRAAGFRMVQPQLCMRDGTQPSATVGRYQNQSSPWLYPR